MFRDAHNIGSGLLIPLSHTKTINESGKNMGRITPFHSPSVFLSDRVTRVVYFHPTISSDAMRHARTHASYGQFQPSLLGNHWAAARVGLNDLGK